MRIVEVYVNDSSLIKQVKTLSVSSGGHMPVIAIMNTDYYTLYPRK